MAKPPAGKTAAAAAAEAAAGATVGDQPGVILDGVIPSEDDPSGVTQPDSESITFNPVALASLGIRLTEQQKKARPYTVRSYAVSGKGQYLGTVKAATDETDAIGQMVAVLKIASPERWLFQAQAVPGTERKIIPEV